MRNDGRALTQRDVVRVAYCVEKASIRNTNYAIRSIPKNFFIAHEP